MDKKEKPLPQTPLPKQPPLNVDVPQSTGLGKALLFQKPRTVSDMVSNPYRMEMETDPKRIQQMEQAFRAQAQRRREQSAQRWKTVYNDYLLPFGERYYRKFDIDEDRYYNDFGLQSAASTKAAIRYNEPSINEALIQFHQTYKRMKQTLQKFDEETRRKAEEMKRQGKNPEPYLRYREKVRSRTQSGFEDTFRDWYKRVLEKYPKQAKAKGLVYFEDMKPEDF